MLGPHPGHGPAPAEWWDQDSGQPGFCRPGGSPEKWLVLKVLVTLRWALLAQFSAFPFNGADLYEELKTSTAILSTGIGRFVCVREGQSQRQGHLTASRWADAGVWSQQAL